MENKELYINVGRDFSRYIGPREKRVAKFSGEEFRERFLDANINKYDRISIDLDGVLGYPWDFLDETFGVMARQLGQELFWEKFNLISRNTYVLEKITYIVDQSKKG